jgi:hypothetical protein
MGSFEHCIELRGFIKWGEVIENPQFIELWIVAGYESVLVY